MNYSEILEKLKQNHRVARAGWNGPKMWIALVAGDKYTVDGEIWSGECLPFIGMKTVQETFVPWLCSQTDMLADDWYVVV